MPLSSSRVRASFFWPQFVFGLLHLALSSPMIYLALGLPLLMRQHGWSGLEIGLFQLAGVPAVFKLLLAAPIERAPDERATPAYQARRYRAWSLALGAGYGAALLALAFASIHSARPVLFALLLACVLLATWADVPVSALQIRVLPPAERARAGGMRSAAMFGAAVLGGGVMLVLSQRLGWSAPFYGMAGLLALALALLPTLRMDGAGEDDGGARPSAETGVQASPATWPALLRGFLAQPGAWRWLALLSGCFPLVGAAWVYLKPMLLGQGFAAEQVAWIVGVGGGALGAAASLLTGLLAPAARLPALLPRATWFGAAALAALAACLACQASAAWLIAASGWLACATGISASVAFGLMMERARPACQAADYGLQASFFALGRLALMPLAGWLLDGAGSAALVAALAVASAGMAALAGRWMDALARGQDHQKKERIKAL